MASIENDDLNDYIKELEKLEKKTTQKIIGSSIYAGAGIIADEIKKEIDGLKVGNEGGRLNVTAVEKKELKEGFGIAPLQYRNGDYDVKIGFAGYGHKTKKYKQGVPIPLIARAVISGTSFRNKNDFVGRAVRRKRKMCLNKMDNVFNEEIEKEMKK